MADIVTFRPGGRIIYQLSVNTPDYENDPDTIINPDLTGLIAERGKPSVETKYWKRQGNRVVEMNAAQKAVVDNARQDRENRQMDRFEHGQFFEFVNALIKVGNDKWANGQNVTLGDLQAEIRRQVPPGAGPPNTP